MRCLSNSAWSAIRDIIGPDKSIHVQTTAETAEGIVDEAKMEAARIIEHAKKEAELEKKRVADDMKKEMVAIASCLAGKVVAASIDTTVQDSLIDETIKEMGDKTWLS